MASSNKTRIEIELGVDKRDIVREIERIQKNPPKMDVRLLANNSDAVGIARAFERVAKSTRESRENIRKIAEISRSAMSGAGAAAISPKSVAPVDDGPIVHLPWRPSTQKAKPELSEEERRDLDQRKAAYRKYWQERRKSDEKEFEAFFNQGTPAEETPPQRIRRPVVPRPEFVASIQEAMRRKAQRDREEQKRINSGLDKVVQMDGVQSLMETTGKELQAASGGGGRGKPPVKQQQKYNELLKAGVPLLRAVGIAGVASFTGIGTAAAALTATTLKLVSRMKEAEEFAKSLHLIGNELKGLATRINVLGYYTDDMINQFVDAQVQAEKLAWQNRFLTEEDKQLAETFRGLRTGLSAFAGTMVDIVGQIVSDFLPSFESVREFMVNQVAPAAAVVMTAFEVMADGLKTVFNFLIGVLSKFVSYMLKLPTYISNVGQNLVTIWDNIVDNMAYGIQSFWEDTILLFPDHFRNFVNGFVENITILLKNIGGFFGNMKDLFKRWWSGEINFSDIFSKEEMEKLFADWDSNSAMYKRDSSGNVMLDENGNKIVDTERGFIDTDSKIRENKRLRDQAFLLEHGLTQEDLNDPEKVSATWKLTRGMIDVSTGTEGGLAEIFSKIGDENFSKIGETLDKYSGGIEGIEKKNKEKIAGLMQKNWQQEAEKDRPTFNMGPWERLQTLLTQNQKASTESLASAYDRINNAVANRNPVVEAIQKQMESQRAFEEETKAMDKKSLEYQERSKEQEEKMAGALQGIYDFLHRNNPQLAAVVEG